MTADRPATEPRRPARNDDERCVVQDCPNRHEWFYGPGLYLCDPHVKAIEAEAAPLDPRWCHDKECFLLEKGVWGHPVSAHEQWVEDAPLANQSSRLTVDSDE